MSVPEGSQGRPLPTVRGVPAVWAEWAGRQLGLFEAIASSERGISTEALAWNTGYDLAAVDLWLRVAYAHGLVAFDPSQGYTLAPRLRRTPPSSAGREAPEAWHAYPPPYLLSCDLAVFIRLVPAEAAARWAGAPVRSSFGRAQLLVLVARYREAEVGTGRKPLLPSAGRPYLYQEVACAVPLQGVGTGAYTFPALWVDSPDRLPLDLGWRYGFPKYPAAANLNDDGRRITATGSDAEGALIEAEGWKLVTVPVRVVAAAALMRAVFPASGLSAVLRLEHIETAWLLLPRRLRLPRLEGLGLTGPTVAGLWLEGVLLYLSEPSAVADPETHAEVQATET